MRTVHPVPAPRVTVYQMAYFPPAEYEAAWAHGLLNATSYRDHADYRRETEQALRAMAERPAAGIRVVPLDLRDLRHFILQLGTHSPEDRQQKLQDREEDLADRAADLRRAARRAWKLPFASFALGAAGAAWEIAGQNDAISAALVLGSAIAGVAAGLPSDSRSAGAYSYLFSAQRALSNRY